MSAEGKEPHPYVPAWTVTLGEIAESGNGLLPPRLHQLKDAITAFVLHLPGWTLSVIPGLGQIRFDSKVVFQDGDAARGDCRLLWYRRMEKELATRDQNTGAAHCLWYGIGIQNPRGKAEFRVFEDGRVFPA